MPEANAKLPLKSRLSRAWRLLRETWGTLTAKADILGTVIVAFFLEKLPWFHGLSDATWFTPTVVIVGTVVFFVLLALQGAADILAADAQAAGDRGAKAAAEGNERSAMTDLRNLKKQYDELRETAKFYVDATSKAEAEVARLTAIERQKSSLFWVAATDLRTLIEGHLMTVRNYQNKKGNVFNRLHFHHSAVEDFAWANELIEAINDLVTEYSKAFYKPSTGGGLPTECFNNLRVPADKILERLAIMGREENERFFKVIGEAPKKSS